MKEWNSVLEKESATIEGARRTNPQLTERLLAELRAAIQRNNEYKLRTGGAPDPESVTEIEALIDRLEVLANPEPIPLPRWNLAPY